MERNLEKSLVIASTLLAVSCSPAVQGTAQNTVLKESIKTEYDCSQLDLTKKSGFKTSFKMGENQFCYQIPLSKGELSEAIFDCNDQGIPLAGHSMIIRGLSGPYKNYMRMNVVLEVSGDTITYVPFLRNPHGRIIYDNGIPEPSNLEQLFKNGSMMLDLAKNNPEVCKRLLEYDSSEGLR